MLISGTLNSIAYNISILLCLLLHFFPQLFIKPYQIIWTRQWHSTPVLLPGKSHGQRSLVGCSPWGLEESDTTERLHFHFSLSRIGEGNGNPLQYSCLENPRDGGAWWAAVYGVAQSWTRLKRLSSSSSIRYLLCILAFLFLWEGFGHCLLYRVIYEHAKTVP